MSDKIEVDEEFQKLLDALPDDSRKRIMEELEESKKSSDIFLSDMIKLIMNHFASITSRVPFPNELVKNNIESLNDAVKNNWQYYINKLSSDAFTTIITSLSFYVPTYDPKENAISFKKTKLDS